MMRTFLAMAGAAVLLVTDLRAGTEEGWDASMRMFVTEGVKRIYLAARLADIGDRDPLLLASAARLTAGAGGRRVDVRPHLEYGSVSFEMQPGMQRSAIDHSPEGLLAEARIAAKGNGRLIELVDATVEETKRLAAQAVHSGPNFYLFALPPGGRATYQIKFYRGRAVTAVVGSSVSRLDLVVRDRSGVAVCEAREWSDHQLCEWNVAQTATYELIVENPGGRTDEFRLYVN
jgi:hypothetical protein